MSNQPALEVSIVLDAAPADVWAAVTDLKAMRRRSPELVGTWFLGAPRVGRRGINLNRRKAFFWPTLSRISQWTAPSDATPGVFGFHVWPTDVEWSYEVAPEGAGTRLTERRTAVVDPSLMVVATAKLALGGQDGHDAELVDGMQATVDAIAAELSPSRA
ncbi:MAG: SRPBCC family protein [Aeromicrobium sp.]|uniref:SRPBCC family protein n=1 Tax=Aeromicrobium sp. TaxID=1871063 RepID=UPI003C4564B9